MEDRYLFKAKIKENNNTGYKELDWIIGNLVVEQSTGRHFIIDLSHFDENTKLCDVMVEIDPSTICKCTGLKDKNGTLIWEKDIVSFEHKKIEDVLSWDFTKYIRNYVIEFKSTFVNYGLRFRNKSIHFECKQSTLCTHNCEVIGNEIDNPELLGGGKE